MKPTLGLALGTCLAVAIGCAAGPGRATAPPSSTAQGMPGTAEDPHAEIARLDRAIDAELAQRGLPPAAAPACTGAGCATAAQPMATTSSSTEAPTCRPGPSDTCKDTCTLADSICANAGRICDLAGQLGGEDAYANETCAKGRASCETSRGRCCTCQL